jgi:hypothetical protein
MLSHHKTCNLKFARKKKTKKQKRGKLKPEWHGLSTSEREDIKKGAAFGRFRRIFTKRAGEEGWLHHQSVAF